MIYSMRALIPCLVVLTACNGFIGSAVPPPPPPGVPALHLVGNFSSPVYLTAAPGDTRRLFVVEQYGRVVVLHNDTIQTPPFLDLTGRIAAGCDQGLLSLAFEPHDSTTGLIFVYFTHANSGIRIRRYHVSSAPDNTNDTT